MRCVLHIGADKTGTSSIQWTLAANAAAIAARNFHYLAAGRQFDRRLRHRSLGFHFAMRALDRPARDLQATLGFTDDDSRRRYRQQFARDFDREVAGLPDEATVVISDEALFVYSEPATAANAAAFLKPRFAETEIIVYLRRPDLYLASRYSQHVKMGGRMTLAEYAAANAHKRLYFNRLKNWSDAFGRPHLIIRPFDRAVLAGGDVVVDLLGQIGLDSSGLDIVRSNVSLTPLGCAIKRRINLLYKRRPPPHIVRATVNRLFSGGGVRIPPALVGRVHAAWRADHQLVIEHFMAGEEDRLYRLDDMLDGED